MPEYGLPVETIDLLSEIPADKSGRDRFQVVDQFAQFNRGVRSKKQVDMVSLAVELDKLAMPFLKRLLKDRPEPFEHFLRDHLAAIFSDYN
jgi:hypothetical protein